MTKLTDELKTDLMREFFLVRRGAFWGGLIGVLIAVGLISWGSAQQTLTTWSQTPVLERLDKADAIATRLINDFNLTPVRLYQCPRTNGNSKNAAWMTTGCNGQVSSEYQCLVQYYGYPVQRYDCEQITLYGAN
ncbi:MAG: hypothetical protein ACFB2Z_11815 [Maricaulaceae bacterium]